jgi:hypothetical protein
MKGVFDRCNPFDVGLAGYRLFGSRARQHRFQLRYELMINDAFTL